MSVFLVIVGGIGLIVGSFLTVVVSRIGTEESILWTRSRCPHCKEKLSWYELLPVLSYLAQNGQCRSCERPIARTYLVIELSTSILLILVGYGVFSGALPTFASPLGVGMGFPSTIALLVTFLYYAFFTASAVAIAMYDYLHKLIPGALVLPLVWIGLIAQVAHAIVMRDAKLLVVSGLTAAAIFFLFWGIWFFSRGRAMGRGDADIALAIAITLGPATALIGLAFAFWLGAIFGILSLVAGRLGWKSEMPFAPFLFLGALVALGTTNAIIRSHFFW